MAEPLRPSKATIALGVVAFFVCTFFAGIAWFVFGFATGFFGMCSGGYGVFDPLFEAALFTAPLVGVACGVLVARRHHQRHLDALHPPRRRFTRRHPLRGE